MAPIAATAVLVLLGVASASVALAGNGLPEGVVADPGASLRPRAAPPSRATAREQLRIGDAAYENKEHDRAVAALSETIRLEPRRALADYRQAVEREPLLERKDEFVKARKEAEAAAGATDTAQIAPRP